MPVAEGFPPLMLRVLTDPGFRADPDKLAGVLLAEWSAWDIPGDVLGPALLEGNENLRKRPPGTTIWFSPSGLSSYPWYHRNSTPMFSVWLLLAALRDDVALPREVREAAPALADLCDIRAALGRERWRKAGRHLCAAAWLEEQTPTDKLLEKAVDDWNSPTDMKLIIQAWSGGGRIVPQGPLAETGRHPFAGRPTDRGGPGRGRTARLRRLGARPMWTKQPENA